MNAILIRNYYLSLSPSRGGGSLLRKLVAWLRFRREAVPGPSFERGNSSPFAASAAFLPFVSAGPDITLFPSALVSTPSIGFISLLAPVSLFRIGLRFGIVPIVPFGI